MTINQVAVESVLSEFYTRRNDEEMEDVAARMIDGVGQLSKCTLVPEYVTLSLDTGLSRFPDVNEARRVLANGIAVAMLLGYMAGVNATVNEKLEELVKI